MHKKYLSPLVLFIASTAAIGQVAINADGSAPHPSAILHVKSNKEILIPQINLPGITDVTTISSPAISLLIFNRNGEMRERAGIGYYYYTDLVWVKLSTERLLTAP